MPGFQKPSINFQFRADNSSQVWLNSVVTTLIGPSPSSFSGPALTGGTSDASKFRTGLNCLYVLVEDTGGAIGFNLSGTVTATGLMPVAGSGTAPNPSFAPCECGGPAHDGPANRQSGAVDRDDAEVVRAIVKVAEERRLKRVAR
jgi:hypothetical protein